MASRNSCKQSWMRGPLAGPREPTAAIARASSVLVHAARADATRCWAARKRAVCEARPQAWEDLWAETVQRGGCRTCSISPTVLLAAFLPEASSEQKSPVTLEASSSTDCVRDTLSLALTTRGDQRLARRGAEGAMARRAALGSATQLRLALRVAACCILLAFAVLSPAEW